MRRPSIAVAVALLLGASLAAVVGLSIAAAWQDRGMAVDDAYITFRYAENLRAGHGLRWNPDSAPCEGYSNLSYVVLIAGLDAVGLDPASSALVLATAGLLLLALLLGRAVFAAGRWAPLALAPALLLFGQSDLQVHASRGLETCLFGALAALQVVAAARLASTRVATGRHAVFAAACGAALFLTRPDGVLVSACCWAAVAWLVRRNGARRRLLTIAVAAWLGAGALYAVWKLFVFGHLLPNPFYMKSGDGAFQGIQETLAFVADHRWLLGLCAAAALLALTGRRATEDRSRPDSALPGAAVAPIAFTVVAVWLVYGSKIVHEIGFAHRFNWPMAPVAALGAAQGLATLRMRAARWPHLAHVSWLAAAAALWLVLPTLQQHVRLLQQPPRQDRCTEMFLRLGRAIASSGVAPELTLYCAHAGATPFAAGAHHVDPAGLVDNGYCKRTPPEERAAYEASLLTRLDVISWNTFPASPGAETLAEDARARSSRYLNGWVLGNDPDLDTAMRKSVENVSAAAREQFVFGYMKILRDMATLVGEMHIGDRRWRTFVYVWKTSRHHDRLVAHLRERVDVPVEEIDYDDWPKTDRNPK